MARILTVGVATLDVVISVDDFPREDVKMRARGVTTRRGGNAANTAVVLSQLGHDTSWAGSVSTDGNGDFITRDLARAGVKSGGIAVQRDGALPVSYILNSVASGSRTIIHHRDLPEFNFEDFRRLDLRRYDWLHFEGRNVAETRCMLAHYRGQHSALPCSLEVEKPREGIEELFELADVLLFSRQYARARGFEEPGSLLAEVAPRAPRALLVCAWGEAGAWARTYEGEEFHSPACSYGAVVDTIGAGDVLNAGVIHGLVNQQPLNRVLPFGCQLAGVKCAQEGLEDLLANYHRLVTTDKPAQP
ncbi:MAG: PfkB family carbohydrate kinase [Gammaproteobacteria bacterium]|nr:PfkB family carbohydrate kinase [Gammaproteobacteria bacterium]